MYVRGDVVFPSRERTVSVDLTRLPMLRLLA